MPARVVAALPSPRAFFLRDQPDLPATANVRSRRGLATVRNRPGRRLCPSRARAGPGGGRKATPTARGTHRRRQKVKWEDSPTRPPIRARDDARAGARAWAGLAFGGFGLTRPPAPAHVSGVHAVPAPAPPCPVAVHRPAAGPRRWPWLVPGGPRAGVRRRTSTAPPHAHAPHVDRRRREVGGRARQSPAQSGGWGSRCRRRRYGIRRARREEPAGQLRGTGSPG